MTQQPMAPPSAPAKVPQTRGQRLVAPLTTIGVLGVATLALHLRDPHAQGSWGFCPSAALGFWCPGCGGLRAVNDMTNGQLLDAASSNLAFVVALPFVVAALAMWTLERWRGRRRPVSPSVLVRVGVGVLALVAVFTVLRNLSGSWLAP